MQPDTHLFPVKKTINCKGRLLDLSQGIIMGVLNATPDSFYDGGKYELLDEQLRQCEKMLKEGAAIIDIGGYSTRPGAQEISTLEEQDRVLPIIEKLINAFPDIIISIDTFRSAVAKAAVASGAAIINDISAGDDDEDMFETVAELQVPYIIMHKQGSPDTMQIDPHYENVVKELLQYFNHKLETLRSLGVNDIIIDPGFGFGKTVEHNYQLLKHLHVFRMFGLPVMAGVSRKSMINKILKTKPENALNGTTVVNTLALQQGASILRVHDVKPAMEALKILNYYREVI
jgi:dihydropteroate synthase